MKRALLLTLFGFLIEKNSTCQETKYEQLALNYFFENIIEEENYQQFRLFLNPTTSKADFGLYDFPRCFKDYLNDVKTSKTYQSETDIFLVTEASWNIKTSSSTKISKRKRYIEVSRHFTLVKGKTVVILSVYRPSGCDKYFIEFDNYGNYQRHCQGGYVY
ncbi:hypothetical protein [Roseivirga thermotolerans]|uniref:Secreted protein n=1 Tax=Roseivirga thermotolerans TaxID=1758176 RepID=A0ABQ3I302_9BACT|nr:hypothetical protein [Roseivirga thermotolerans]GHE53183.1 hypothetical protein GCM10011340_04500 [Roseivirga thermotolerans]